MVYDINMNEEELELIIELSIGDKKRRLKEVEVSMEKLKSTDSSMLDLMQETMTLMMEISEFTNNIYKNNIFEEDN